MPAGLMRLSRSNDSLQGTDPYSPMRLIEHRLLAAILQQKNFRRSNTNYRLHPQPDNSLPPIGLVHLYGHHIASYLNSPPLLTVRNAGFNTNTTNSRLNALLRALTEAPVSVTRSNGGRIQIGHIDRHPVIDLPMGRDRWYTLPAIDVIRLTERQADAYPFTRNTIPYDDAEAIFSLFPTEKFKATSEPFGLTVTSTAFNETNYLEDLRNLERVPELVRMDRTSPGLLRPGIGSIWDRYRTAGA